MKLTDKQIEILNKLNESIEQGDVTEISKRAGFTYAHTWRVLNPFIPAYNDKIIEAAANLIAERRQGRKKMYQKILA